MTKDTQVRSAADMLTDAANEYARAVVDTSRNTDVTYAAIAINTPATMSDRAVAEAFSIAAATYGEARFEGAWQPTDAVPVWDEYLRLAAKRAPYAISPKTVGNLKNAVRFLRSAGIPTDNPVALADAKRLVSKGADAAIKRAADLKNAADPMGALADMAGTRGKTDAESDARREAKAVADKDARAQDPYGFAALLGRVQGDADAAQALADAARALVTQADRIADAARGGSAVVDVRTGEPLAA